MVNDRSVGSGTPILKIPSTTTRTLATALSVMTSNLIGPSENVPLLET